MTETSKDYHISFFKPTTPQAVSNRNLTLWLVSIWAVAIFGFQILLKILEEPTPEPAYNSFVSAWENIENGNASESDYKELAKSSLSVLGKIFIGPEEKPALNNALNWSLYQIQDEDSLKSLLVQKIRTFESIKDTISTISEPTYVEAKNKLSVDYYAQLGLEDTDPRINILPLELNSSLITELTTETKSVLPGVMSKYLIHNQSVLTDTKFLGFPFHYFYTAVFLLILFVGLCLLYCIRTDQINAKLNIVD